ncbi:low temperature requirement protein A [Homoserinibacter sp. YIM 151385]|uniref:low temperature requirement protein A n=1 Tax=Homoserinibacter sp. YIM 151385 TaxID=2985506 RepID=UPI0022F12DDC|nr:low temperature requirement protein A [Homoserinibacter sp. YIM 151385]WBU36745.1 low temperature requirement protein A [Homoserinibacter sp. YIM 151385]
MAFGFRRDLTRPDDGEGRERVAFVELFFDLIFVFALTQLSAYLSTESTPLGALEGAIMVCALWWVWISTTWLTNWLDPRRLPVRSAVIALALLALVLSVSITQAFGDRAWAFALTYVAMQLLRAVVMILATWRHDREAARTFVRVLVWQSAGGALWIGGALLPLPFQLPMWGAALAVEYVSATVDFRTPGLGRSKPETWDLSGAHLAERAALFVLIALGETFLVTGFAFAGAESTPAAVAGVASAFVAAAAMWWIYFDHGEREGSAAISAADRPGRLARTAYTYVHLAVIGGIVLTSVGDKEVLAHPHELSPSGIVTILGGPALFLIGTLLFRFVVARRWMLPHLAGLVALAAAAVAASALTPLALGLVASGVLVAVAVGETAVRVREGREQGG